MPLRELTDGITVVNVPAGLSIGGEQDWILSNVPGATNELVGLESIDPSAGVGVNEAQAIALGRQLTGIGIGENIGTAGRAQLEANRPIATAVGQSIVPFAAGGLVAKIPALAAGLPAIAAQGAVQAGFEATNPDATLQSIGVAGAAGAGGQALGNMASRVVTGVGRNVAARRAAQPLSVGEGVRGTQLGNMSRAMASAGANNSAMVTQNKAMNTAVAKVFDFTDDAARAVKEIDGDFLQVARQVTNGSYVRAAPSGPVAISGKLRAALGSIPKVADAEVSKVLQAIDGLNQLPPAAWQGIQRTLRDITARLSKNPLFNSHAIASQQAIDLLDNAAVVAGGNKALLGRANQQFKILATLEEINSILLNTGEVPAGELVRKMAREGFKGFGRRALAEGPSNRVIPEIAELMSTAKIVGRFMRDTAGGSPTAGRNMIFGGALTGLGGAATGVVSPATAAVAGAGLAVPKLTGLAALGTARFGGVPGRAAGSAAAARLSETQRDLEK